MPFPPNYDHFDYEKNKSKIYNRPLWTQSGGHQCCHGLTLATSPSGPFPRSSSALDPSACRIRIPTRSGSEFLPLFHSSHTHTSLPHPSSPDNPPYPFNSSDGPQPHFITVEFPRKMAIQVGNPTQPNQRRTLRPQVPSCISRNSDRDTPFTPVFLLRPNTTTMATRNSACTSATSSTIPTRPPRSPYVPAPARATYKRCARSRSTVRTVGSPLTSLRSQPTMAKACACTPPFSYRSANTVKPLSSLFYFFLFLANRYTRTSSKSSSSRTT